MQHVLGQIWNFYVLGGPVVGILTILSVVALGTILYKLWSYQQAGLGRNKGLDDALAAVDAGQTADAALALSAIRSPFAVVIAAAMSADGSAADGRVDAMAEATLADFETGFRLLDAIAQTAPLLGLFGTVLGMIEAFQAMQGAGASVDPSVLAGGIWVALLTTAVGLAVAIPTSMILTWFEGRVARERGWLAGALARVRAPTAAPPAATATRRPQAVLINAG